MKFFRPRKISNILAVFRESREEPNFHSLALDLCFRVLGLFCFLFCFFYSLLKVCGFSSLLLSGRENAMWYTVNYDLFLFLCPFFLLSKSSRVFFFSLLPDSFSFFLSISLPIPWGQRQPGITEGDDLARTWRREGSRRPGQLLRRPDLTWPAPAPGGSPWHGARSLGFHIN